MKLQVIIGSTRPGRVSDRVAKWAEAELKKIEGVETELVDLADYELPFMNEPLPPRFNPDRQPEGVVKRWLDKIAEADGYVIVSPEYNRGVPAVLKNALDFLDLQMDNKAVAIVAHGSTGGAQAVANLRITLPGTNAASVPTATMLIGRADQLLSEAGELDEEVAKNPYGPATSIKATCESLAFYARALKAAREA